MSRGLSYELKKDNTILGFVNRFGFELQDNLREIVPINGDKIPMVDVNYNSFANSSGYVLYWALKRESLPYPAFLGEIWVQPVKDDDSVTLQRWGGITPLLIHGRSNQEYTPVDLRSAAKVHDSVADFLKEKYGSSE